MSIATAITRLQALALACTDIKAAPSTPVEDAGVLPISIAHLTAGQFSADDATAYRGLHVINVDFHFARMSMKDAYTRIDRLIQEYAGRLAGDPRLANAVDTIVFPVPYSVSAVQWDSVATQMVSFQVTIKIREASTST